MTNFMDSYGVPEVACSVVTNSTKQITEDGRLPPFYMPSQPAGKHYYGVRVVNGKMENAGTSGGVSTYAILVGTKTYSKKVPLLRILDYLLKGMKSSTYEDILIETHESLGDIQVVILGIDGGTLALNSSWFVSYAEVVTEHSPSVMKFPCYHWIGANDYVSITSNTAIPNAITDDSILSRERANQLEKRKEQYQWHLFSKWGLPSGIDVNVPNLPLDEQFGRVKNIDFTEDALKGFSSVFAGISVGIKSLHNYADLAKHIDDGDLSLERTGLWLSDVEFGRQMLNGVNPVLIEKCTSLPKNFPVTNEMVQPLLTQGKTLQEEMEDGKVYICDTKIMEGMPTKENCYAPAAICLLYVNASKQLVPIAIQIKQKAGKDNPIFLPNDHHNDWMLAKMYYQSAHGQIHELCAHYECCHAAMEAYAMATLRNLPDAHPINKLLLPHFRYTMAINTRARATLIVDGGIIDQLFSMGTSGRKWLFKEASSRYSVDLTNIRKNVKARGVDDPDKLPGYYYRDDGLKIFEAIESYVSDVVNIFYKKDEDVVSDYELQNWARDIHTNGFPGYFDGKEGHDFPAEITTVDQLIERCTVIIFTGSAQHAAVNFGQYYIYGFVPNAPGTIRKPPPEKKSTVDFQHILATLPEKFTAAGQIGFTYMLSQYSSGEIYLGDYPYKRFTEPDVLIAIKNFKLDLTEISEIIKARNKDLEFPYVYLLPENIPNSITI